MKIDFHTHVFPDKLAQRAIPLLSEKADIKANFDGTVNGLIENMDQNGVDISVVNSIATNEHQMASVNDFAIELSKNNRVIPFGSVFPFSPMAYSEIIRLKDNGIKGIKLHPEYQQFEIDDKRVYGIFELCAKLGMLVTLHCGADAGYCPPFHSDPLRLRKMLDANLSTTFVLAHFGSYNMWDDVVKYLCGVKNAYIDTSMSNTKDKISVSVAQTIINLHGADKILYATDMPWESPKSTVAFIESLDLSDRQKQMIYYKNACSLLGINV